MSQAPVSPWLTPREAAKYLRCSELYLQKNRQGEKPIPYSRLGRKVLYNQSDLDVYMRAVSSSAR